MNPFEAWWNMKELSRKVILDLGCMRNVVGVQWANDVVQEWQRHKRWFKVLPEEEVFRFGDGNTLKSKYRLQLEATFGGKRICLAFSVVCGPCPRLLSKKSHTILGVQLDTSQHTLSSRKLKVKNDGLQETEAGHYTMKIDEFHLLDDVWHVPQDFVMDSDVEAMFTVSVDSNDREVFGLKLARECRPRAPLDGHPALVNPPQCRLCGAVGHRTSQCPEMSDDEESFVMTIPEGTLEAQQEEAMRLSDTRECSRKQAPQNMDVEPKRRD